MVAANTYKLVGAFGFIQIQFGIDLQGRPQLVLNGKSFGADEIIDEKTAAGRLVSVMTESIPDLQTRKLSVLIPLVNLGTAADPSPVMTVALVSTERTSIGGPALVPGQVTTYEMIPLMGSASLVMT